MPTFVDYVPDWRSRLLGRLLEQFRGKPITEAMISIVAVQAQDTEDAAQTLFTIASIDDSYGVQLDQIGAIVGQDRSGVDDATYRLYLKARVVTNRSSGAPDEIYAVFFALGSTVMKITASPPASFVLHVDGALDAAHAAVDLAFLRDAKDAGVRAIFEWSPTDDAHMFTMGDAGAPSSDVHMGFGNVALPMNGGQFAGALDA